MEWAAELLRRERQRIVIGLAAAASCTAVYKAATAGASVAVPPAHRALSTRAPFPKPYPRQQRRIVHATLEPEPEPDISPLDNSQHIAELEARVAKLASTMESSIAKISSTQRKLELEVGNTGAAAETAAAESDHEKDTDADDPPDAPVTKSSIRRNPAHILAMSSDSDDSSDDAGRTRFPGPGSPVKPARHADTATEQHPATSPSRSCSDSDASSSASSFATAPENSCDSDDSGSRSAEKNPIVTQGDGLSSSDEETTVRPAIHRDGRKSQSNDSPGQMRSRRSRMPLSSDSDSDSDGGMAIFPPRTRRTSMTAPATTARSRGTGKLTTNPDSVSDVAAKSASRPVSRHDDSSDSDSEADSRTESAFRSRLKISEANADRAKKRLEARRGGSMFAKGQRRRNFASGSFEAPKKPNRFVLED